MSEKEILSGVSIPEFSEFKNKPQNELCVPIDSTRLIVEILWWLKPAGVEFQDSVFSSKIILDWNYSLVIRYKREKDNIYHPACTLSFNLDDNWNICINQLQGSNDRNVSFRFHSSFNHISFYIKLIEESFSKNWIYIYVVDFPKCLEWASYSSKAIDRYRVLSNVCQWLNRKYWLSVSGLKSNSTWK